MVFFSVQFFKIIFGVTTLKKMDMNTKKKFIDLNTKKFLKLYHSIINFFYLVLSSIFLVLVSIFLVLVPIPLILIFISEHFDKHCKYVACVCFPKVPIVTSLLISQKFGYFEIEQILRFHKNKNTYNWFGRIEDKKLQIVMN